MQETQDTKMQVQSLSRDVPLKEEMVTHSSILAWKNPMDRGTWRATIHRGRQESDTTEQLSTHNI